MRKMSSPATHTKFATFASAALLWSVLLYVALFPPPVQAQLYGTNPNQNGGGDTGALYRFDPDTFAYILGSGIQVTLAGFTITGVNSVTIDPTTGVAYAVVKVSTVSGRVLVTVDLTTGVATQIGNLGDNFASIAFRGDGQLFGVTGDGASVRETLYEIDKTDGTKTLAQSLGAGADGEVIAYNPRDGFFYHWSGNATVVFEKFPSTAPYVPITNIPVIGTINETFGAVWDECRGLFIGSNRGARFNLWNPDGTVGPSVGAYPSAVDIRGLALVGMNGCDVDLTTSLGFVPAPPTLGGPLTVTLSVLNNGPARALTPSVALTIPANVTGVATSGCTEDPTGVPTCTLPATLFDGDTATVTLTGTYATAGGSIIATATSTSNETNVSDNTASLSLPTPEIAVTGNAVDIADGDATPDLADDTDFGGVRVTAATRVHTFTLTNSGTVDLLLGAVTVSGSHAADFTVNLPPTSPVTASSNTTLQVTFDPSAPGVRTAEVNIVSNDSDENPFTFAIQGAGAEVTVTPTSGLITTEGGGTDTFTVVLTAPPTTDVTIALRSSDTTEGTVPAGLTFTSRNWATPQLVTVTGGGSDGIVDGNIPYSIVTTATSTDPVYDGIAVADVDVINSDDGVPVELQSFEVK